MFVSLVCTATCSNVPFESFELKQHHNDKNIKEVLLPDLNDILKEANLTERVSTLKAKLNFFPGKVKTSIIKAL